MDINTPAAKIGGDATAEEEPWESGKDAKRMAAAILGRSGGIKGGPARAAALSAERRSEIARKAARARWEKRDDSG